MIWENKYNLPAPIVNAVKRDTYNRGKSDVTVTQLVVPPRIAILRQKYAKQIVEDVADGFFRMLGTCIHKILEEKDTEAIVEKRLYSPERLQGLILSGQLDRYDPKTNTIQDYKFTTCYSAMNGAKVEWIGQLNILAFLARENGLQVDNLELILLLRDFSKSKAEKNSNYPQTPVIRIPVEVFSEEKIEWYLLSRLQEFVSARNHLPLCSDEDRWKQPDSFAVYKPEGKRALKVFDTREEADSFIESSEKELVIQERKGNYIRCESYCQVSKFCNQWRERLVE
jgi:hypothetical protein